MIFYLSNSSIVSSKDKLTAIYTAIGVVIFTAAAYFFSINAYPLLDPDEGRYAEIAREMIETGDFVTPHLNYVKYLEKPPFFYWLTAASMGIFGQNEIAVRILPSLAGLLTVLLVMGLGRQFFNARGGVMAGWIYVTSALPFAMARLPIIDGLFSLLLSAVWGAWWMGYNASTADMRQRWYITAWISLGMAVMTKGPVAVALTGGIVLLYLIVRHDLRALRQMAWWRGGLIFLFITVPWHIAAYLQTPQFAHFYFVKQHLGRLIGSEHYGPFWFFIAVFPFTMLPWSAFLFLGIWDAVRRSIHAIPWLNKNLPTISPDVKAHEEIAVRESRKDEASLFLMIWIIVVIGLFSVSNCKLYPYILPACPAAAILLAGFFEHAGLDNTYSRLCAVITAVFLFLLVPITSYLGLKDNTLPLLQMSLLIRIMQGAFIIGGLLLLIAAFRIRLIPAATGFVLLLTLFPIEKGVSQVSSYIKIGDLVKALPAPLPTEVRIAEWKQYDPSLNFYTRRRITLVDEVGELGFGMNLEVQSKFFRNGQDSILELSKEGPLLINLRPSDWATANLWNVLNVVAANNKNILAGNKAFFDLTRLKPWPTDAVKYPPLLLLPQNR